MAQKKERPSMKPVVKAIAMTTKQLKHNLKGASPAQKKKLRLNIKVLGNLGGLARYLCHNKTTLNM